MACLKCGRETIDPQVFCNTCQEVLARYPVKPGTPVQLPIRATAPVVKKTAEPKKRTIAQQYRQLLAITRWLFLAALFLLILVCVLAFMLFG